MRLECAKEVGSESSPALRYVWQRLPEGPGFDAQGAKALGLMHEDDTQCYQCDEESFYAKY